MSTPLFSKTPKITVVDNRGLTVRDIAYYRHPDALTVTTERITRHQYNADGFLSQSVDPRLYDTGQVNFAYLTSLSGNVLRVQSVDAGSKLALNDAAGRPFMAMSNIVTGRHGEEDISQAVTHTFQYEDASLPGRPLSVTEQVTGEAARITERFVWASNTGDEKQYNLVGQCVSHYDTAGLVQTNSIALSGVPLSITRQLLKEADREGTVADWQGDDAAVWNQQLNDEAYTTRVTADATGQLLTTTDAAGNLQRMAYDIAGLLISSWLTVKDEQERVIVQSLTYSAAGQKLREEQGNGVVTSYTYEPQTQRLIGIKTERPAGHASGAKVLQDLRYEYDPVGNVLSVHNDAEETRFWRNQKVIPENTYTYDSLYQLVNATGREMADIAQQSSNLPSPIIPLPSDNSTYTNYSRTYNYDIAGNLTQIRHSAPATNNSYTINITISDRSNRGVLSTLTENPAEVDALFTAGGQQNMLLLGQLLNWTPRGELQKVTPVTREGIVDDNEHYRYAADSQRILKLTQQMISGSVRTQRVQYLPGLELRSTANNDVITEILQVITMGEAGRAQVQLLHWEMGEPPAVNGNNQLRYSYDNLIGSSCLEVDGEGNIISQEEYYPYGGTAVWTARSQIEADYKTIRYSGKERDATGLYYYGYRYYQPWVGRWLSADPAGTVDGLNLFRMVKNNPITLRDERGLNDDEYEIKALTNESYKQMSTGSYWKIMRDGISSFNDKPEFDYISSYYSAVLEDETRTVTNTPEGSRFVEGFKKLDINLVHFTDANLDSNGKATFFSRDELLSRRIVFDKSHTTKSDILDLQTNDFAFFSLDIGENGKSNSRFGKNKYEIPMKKIADNGYLRESFFAMNDTLYWNKIIPQQWPLAAQKSLMNRMATIFDPHDVDNLMQLELGNFPEETVFSYGEHLNQLAIRMLWPMVAYNSNMSTKGRNTILSTTTPDEYDSLLSILYRVQVLVPVKLETEHFSKK